jgi:hypothetical protein
MINGQIVAAMTGMEIIVAAIVVFLSASVVNRLWRKRISS